MRYEEFVRYVKHVGTAGLSDDRAERAISATLTTLGRCLPADAAHNLAEQLPQPAKSLLTSAVGEPTALSPVEFFEQVAELEGVSTSEARDDTRAVMDALREAVTGHELEHVRAALPDSYKTVFALPAAARVPDTHRRRPHA